MKFYHGTSKDIWEKIKSEGVLFGVRNAPSRCTYLSVDIEEAKCYGEIVLEVDYNPILNTHKNNYIDGCWQLRVYEPILIENVKLTTRKR